MYDLALWQKLFPPTTVAKPFAVEDHNKSALASFSAKTVGKTLRQAYEAAPRTFVPFCRQVTAADFKPVNRVQLSDIAAYTCGRWFGRHLLRSAISPKKTWEGAAGVGPGGVITCMLGIRARSAGLLALTSTSKG